MSTAAEEPSPDPAQRRALLLEQFAQIVRIWLDKPHVANKRIFGATILSESFDESSKQCDVVRRLLPRHADKQSALEETVRVHEASGTADFITKDGAGNVLLEYTASIVTASLPSDDDDEDVNVEVTVRTDSGAQDDAVDSCLLSAEWLRTRLAQRLSKWLQEAVAAAAAGGPAAGSGSVAGASLRLLDLADYQRTYSRLKETYGRALVANWSERTDPQKFVYEDLAIAAYLMSLWSTLPRESINFVDLGCGNGLLVYVLTMEGYRGRGLDLRRRGIWASFPPAVRDRLEECALTPSATQLFPEATWLLGNHSDELTPWLPVLAARSAPDCCFWVLPCCPHDLRGRFQPSASTAPAGAPALGRSRYRAYLDYVAQVARRCGFVAEEDALRIPSTKRVCVVGRRRSYAPADWPQLDMRLTAFIRERCGDDIDAVDGNGVGFDPGFVARAAVEPVRNCTRVARSVRDTVTGATFAALLADEHRVAVGAGSGGRLWNKGGRLALGAVSRLFAPDVLKALKAEHGGLQTLLRNHHQAFCVRGGYVEIRLEDDVTAARPSAAKKQRLQQQLAKDGAPRLKTRPCWLLTNHPDGCPYTAERCKFAHDEDSESAAAHA